MKQFCIAALLIFTFLNVTNVAFTQDTIGFFRPEVLASIQLENIDALNDRGNQFSPASYYGGILYLSPRKVGDREYYKRWYASISEDSVSGPWYLAAGRDSAIHHGAASWDREGRELFFASGKYHFGIYFAYTYAENEWSLPQAFPYNSDEYNLQHPSYDPIRNRLIFSSDMPGGFGGMDLYQSFRKEDGWTEPENLGSAVNGEGHDAFPFIHQAGYLLYASNRKGMGDYDLYLSRPEGNVFGQAQRLAPPFNSNGADLGLILNEDGTEGYFSSDRKDGKGGDDLYRFRSGQPLIPRTETEIATIFYIRDARSGQPIEGASFVLLPYDPAELNDPGQLLKAVWKEQGQEGYRFSYEYDENQLDDHLMYSDARGIIRSFVPIERRYLLLAWHPDYHYKHFLIDAGTLRAKTDMDLFLEKAEFRPLTISVTDKSGDPLEQLELFFTESGSGRFWHVPLKSTNSVKLNLSESKDYKLEVVREGYERKTLQFNISRDDIDSELRVYLEKQESAGEAPDELPDEPVLILDLLEYDRGDSRVRDNYSFELDLLVEMLKQFEEVKVQLGVHTDARGPAADNLQLSERRAQAIKEYLLRRGIAEDRFEVKAFGESRLRNRCADGVDCSEEEHAYNERIEVWVIEGEM